MIVNHGIREALKLADECKRAAFEAAVAGDDARAKSCYAQARSLIVDAGVAHGFLDPDPAVREQQLTDQVDALLGMPFDEWVDTVAVAEQPEPAAVGPAEGSLREQMLLVRSDFHRALQVGALKLASWHAQVLGQAHEVLREWDEGAVWFMRSSRLVGPSGFSQDYEQLGNAALAAGDEELALALFATAFRRALAEEDAVKADPTLEIRSPSACTVAIHRVAWKAAELLDDPPRSPLPILGDLIDKRWAEIDDAAAAGELLVAAERAVKFGDVLDDLGELAQAETAYRRAVHFARELDAADPELLLLTFRSLIDFLPPSAETRALAGELVDKLARPKCHHPMRTAEAACCQAKAELSFVAVDPNALDAALDAVANAIRLCDEVCFHDRTQELQWLTAVWLRQAGREVEAEQWQAEADRYEEWDPFSDQQIPGHVHLWDVRVSKSGGGA